MFGDVFDPICGPQQLMDLHLLMVAHPSSHLDSGSQAELALGLASMTPRSILSSFLSLLTLAAYAPTTPAADPPAPDATAYRAEIREWQQKRQEGLSDPDGWRALVGLDWLEPGDTTAGGAADNGIVLATPNAPPHIGTFTVAATPDEDGHRTVRFRPTKDTEVTIEGEPVTGEIALSTDADGEAEPTILEAGSLRIQVIERPDEKNGTRLALRTRDRRHPRLDHPPQLTFYPIDPAWRFEARFEPYDPPKAIPIVNVLGMVSDVPSPGALVFEKDGQVLRIDTLEEGDQLFLIVGDRTNGKQTYGAGRYLYADKPAGKGGTVLLDLNRLYDPPCAFTSFATCPLPPRQNKLPLEVTAGERWDASYGGHH